MKFLLLLTVAFPILSLAQTAKESADQLFAEESWQKAAEEYEYYLKTNAADSSAWYNLGLSQMNSERYDDALKSLERARTTHYNKHLVGLNVLKTYALIGDEVTFLDNLEKEASNGLATFVLLENSEELAPWQNNERFEAALQQVARNAYPCLQQDQYRHFDFWLGEWDVYVGDQKVGENSITMAKGGCAIHESYITGRNYAGQSINYYDPIDERWHQHWVGAGQDVYNYLEVDRGPGMLQFESPFKNPATGQLAISRLTFKLNEDGTVRQLFESSTDDGKTWTNSFDGLYRKK
ncbi:MAG: hypothetical protein AAGA85_19665, partial [Bacteroidota bacterium]